MPNDTWSSHPMLSYTDRLATAWQDFLILFGRVLLGWIFVNSGWRKLMDMPTFIQTSLVDRNVPFPNFLGYIAAPLEFIGGACIILGFATRYAAIAIFAFTVAATLSSHRYWEFTGANWRTQNTQFWKNISMMSGQALLFVVGAGLYSIDTLLRRK